MNIELKNVKYFAAGSEETSCFTATIYIEGIKSGDARNDGHGGMTIISPYSLQQKLDAYGASLPKISTDLIADQTFEYAQTGETLIDELLTKHLIEKDLRKLLSKKVVYTKKGVTGLYSTKALPATDIAKILSNPTIREKWQVDVMLNEVPFEQAFAIYSTHA